jgi:hypothetical protein
VFQCPDLRLTAALHLTYAASDVLAPHADCTPKSNSREQLQSTCYTSTLLSCGTNGVALVNVSLVDSFLQVKFQIVMTNSSAHTFTLTSTDARRERDKLWNKILALQMRIAQSGDQWDDLDTSNDANYDARHTDGIPFHSPAHAPSHIPSLELAIGQLKQALPSGARAPYVSVLVDSILFIFPDDRSLYQCTCSEDGFVVKCEEATLSGVPVGTR